MSSFKVTTAIADSDPVKHRPHRFLTPRSLAIMLVLIVGTCGVAPALASAADTKQTPHKKAGKQAPSKSIEDKPLPSSMFQEDKGGSKAKPRKSGSGSGAIARALFGLVVVLGSIFGVHWLLKRYGGSRSGNIAGGSAEAIEVVATTPLAANRSLHLVRVGGELVLIGATETSITRIGEIDAQTLATAPMAGAQDFQMALQGALSGAKPSVNGKETFVQRFVSNLQMMTAR